MATDGRRLTTLRGAAVALAATGAFAVAETGPRFTEVASALGVEFEHRDYRRGEKYYVETTGSGVGWVDYDGDGDPDLYLLNGAPAPGGTERAGPNRLFENLGGGRFSDVTERAGVGDRGFGMGMCVGDVDADGRADLMVTNFGPDRLYRNLGEGRFEEIGEAAGVADSRWSSSCAFGDLDGDGDLDLYVTRYLDFRYEDNPRCGGRGQPRIYCRPVEFSGVRDSLYLNQGDGRFVEQGLERGLANGPSERGLGVVVSDLDDDGDLDLYVANDGSPNRLYRNDGAARFEDAALLAGAAVNALGDSEAGMGVAVGDVDGNGLLDLLITHFSMETNTLYLARSGLHFDDASLAAGLGLPSYRDVGWGVELFDADNDGDLDGAIANGHMQEGIERLEPSLAYAQRNRLWVNLGDGSFRDGSAEAGPAWRESRVSRGLAVADFDDDGRLDLVVGNANDRVEVLANRTVNDNHWLGLRLTGSPANPLAIGARVELETGEATQVREVRSGGSFQSQSDLRLHFGLGQRSDAVRLTVRWPDGTRQVESTAELDRYWAVSHPARSR